ncbi:type I secretion outer membrane, TolC family protein [Collimonas fungivorans]|uniref:Type I secretion outer membrane, TolC family protein n=1 Tax=Collimonas fungivorans TaxID=158899 RepID=A0A127P7V8_9BURK|nr:TolC family outer membrane protein [Collimonas fungivorans]AMO93823.1 type I secretion outer membrane, TolC family protein [Collimonas fungivorans]
MRNTLMASLIASALLAANAHAVDLVQTYQQALANDPVYTSARYALSASNESSIQGRAALLPVVGFGGNYSRAGESWKTITNNYSLQLTQPLFRPAYWQQYQESKLSVAAGEVKFAQAEQDLMLRVSQAYFDTLTAQDVLATLQAQKSAIAEQLASAKRNFEVGTATITDSNEAQASYDLVIAQEIAASNNLEVARNVLQQIIGKPPAPLATLRAGVQLSAPQPAAIENWVSSAEQQNFGVVGQEIALNSAKYEIKRNRAGHLPTVDLVASRAHSDVSGSPIPFYNISQMSNSIGVQWTIPLYAGGAVNSGVRQAVALEDKARSDLENARRNAALNARQAYLGVSSGLAQIKAYEAAEISSQSSLDSNRLGYQVGVRINIDVLNAQQQLYSTRRDLAKARYDTLMNSLKLKSAVGALKEEDLQQINALLTPAAY